MSSWGLFAVNSVGLSHFGSPSVKTHILHLKNDAATLVPLNALSARSLSHTLLPTLKAVPSSVSKAKQRQTPFTNTSIFCSNSRAPSHQPPTTPLSRAHAFLFLFSPRMFANILCNWQVVCSAFAMQSA